MRRSRIVAAAAALLALAGVAAAEADADAEQDRALAQRLTADLAGEIEAGWSVRASWRDAALVAFVTPPWSVGWEVISDQTRQREMWNAICAAIDEGLWDDMPEGTVIAIEPVFGGKSITRLRQPCTVGGLADAS